MTFLLYLTGLLFIGAIASFVASPLFTPAIAQEPEHAVDETVVHWEKQKTDAYSAIKEAEFDLQMGKMTQEDYVRLREKYEVRALEALTQLDQLRGEPKRLPPTDRAPSSNES
jgi:hypothetical protein